MSDPATDWFMEAAAQKMACSVAMLRRRLADEKIVFRDLIQDVRMSRAVKTTRYFFSTGPLSRLGSQERDALVATTCLAFNEDKVVIEAQQRLLDLTPNPMMMATLHDKAVTMFNRMAKTMMDEEAAGTTQKVA